MELSPRDLQGMMTLWYSRSHSQSGGCRAHQNDQRIDDNMPLKGGVWSGVVLILEEKTQQSKNVNLLDARSIKFAEA